MMVQYVIDCLSRKHSATMVGVSGSCSKFQFCWRREGSFRDSDLVAASRGQGMSVFAVHIVPSEVTPILLGSGYASRIWSGDKCGFSTLLQYEVAVSDSCGQCSHQGHLALALTPSGSFEDNGGRRKTLVKEDCRRYDCCCPRRFPGIGTAPPSLQVMRANDGGTQKQVPRVSWEV